MSQILVARHPARESTTTKNFPDFQDLEGMSIPLDLPSATQALLFLNIPDSWNDTAQKGTWFAIAVDEVIIARGIYTVASPAQRIPIHLVAANSLDPGQHLIQAKWCRTDGGTSFVGSWSESLLGVILLY